MPGFQHIEFQDMRSWGGGITRESKHTRYHSSARTQRNTWCPIYLSILDGWYATYKSRHFLVSELYPPPLATETQAFQLLGIISSRTAVMLSERRTVYTYITYCHCVLFPIYMHTCTVCMDWTYSESFLTKGSVALSGFVVSITQVISA
jgi:hypothetical protein